MSGPYDPTKPRPTPVFIPMGDGGGGVMGGGIQEVEAGQTVGDDFAPLKTFSDPKTKLPPPDPNMPPNNPKGLVEYYLSEARKAIASNDIPKAKNMILGVRSMISMVKVMAEKGKNPSLATEMEPYEKKVEEFDTFFKANNQ